MMRKYVTWNVYGMKCRPVMVKAADSLKASMRDSRSFTKDEAKRYNDSLVAIATPTGRRMEG
jgi:hypothetical protein